MRADRAARHGAATDASAPFGAGDAQAAPGGLGPAWSRRLSEAWAWLRQVSGDAAYETYARRARATGTPLETREEFYLKSLRRRYSRPSRCC